MILPAAGRPVHLRLRGCSEKQQHTDDISKELGCNSKCGYGILLSSTVVESYHASWVSARKECTTDSEWHTMYF